jgi:ribosomal protein L37E
MYLSLKKSRISVKKSLMSKSYVKCLACNTFNVDRDYCSNCGEIINIVLKRQLEGENAIKEKVEEEKTKAPNKIEVFFGKSLEHSNSVVRFFFKQFIPSGFSLPLLLEELLQQLPQLLLAKQSIELK